MIRMNKQRKILLSLAIVCLTILCIFAFYGCDSTKHEHSYGEWEEVNSSLHARSCDCGEIEQNAHTLSDGKCAICGMVDMFYVPPKDYFRGNIFQIYVKNLGGEVVSFGSGVVLSEDGYFMTNHHVMDGGYYASALFEIPNQVQGTSFTSLEITEVAYDNPDKDLFIGKIRDYNSISSYYQNISITSSYTIAEKTYSVGYPNATPYMEINNGVVTSPAASLEGKLNGVEYIASTSFIAPGSSGGALFNSNLELIGITTLVTQKNGEFVCGYSVSAFNFANDIATMRSHTLRNLTSYMHPNEIEYVKFFNMVSKDSDFVKSVEGRLVTYSFTSTSEGTNDGGVAYTITTTVKFDCDMGIYLYEEYYWANGDRRTQEFLGYWSPDSDFNELQYTFLYSWADGNYYKIVSNEIYYSANVDLTLNKYTLTKAYSYTVSEENIAYAKENFNGLYRMLWEIWNLRNEA